MMNILVICLVLTSIVTGGVWSPAPENPNKNQNPDLNQRDTIVKEGHRVVVVEYEKEGDGNTKVVISPGGVDDKGGAAAGYIHAAGEKLSETAAAAKGAVEDVNDKVKDASYGPRELICDAYGKCKHKLASALGKTKDKVSETAHGVSDRVQDVEEHAKEAIGEAYAKAKEAVTSKTHEGVEKGKEIGGAAKDAVGEASKKMKEKVPDMASKVKDWDVVDSPKRIEQDIRQNVTSIADGPVKETVRHAKEAVEDAVGHAEEAVEEVKEKGKKGLNEILTRGRDVVYDFLCYVLPLRRLDSATDVLQLLGVSTAYGMCVFVSLVSSYVLSRSLTKQQFGMVQSRLYPVYFKALGFAVGVGLLGHLLSQRKRVFTDELVMFQAFDLAAALLTVFANLFYLEPRATKLMFERMKIDKEEGKGQAEDPIGGVAAGLGKGQAEDPIGGVAAGFGDPVCVSSAIGSVAGREGEAGESVEIAGMTARLKRLNMYSSFMNISTMILLSWHLVYLGHRLLLTR